jgi:hypothetical protein
MLEHPDQTYAVGKSIVRRASCAGCQPSGLWKCCICTAKTAKFTGRTGIFSAVRELKLKAYKCDEGYDFKALVFLLFPVQARKTLMVSIHKGMFHLSACISRLSLSSRYR